MNRSLLPALVLVLALAIVPAAAAKTNYTKSVALKTACPIFENYPKTGVPARAWTKTPRSGHVGLRYNVNSHYVLVLDYARGRAHINPHWGFLDRGCLRDQLGKPNLVGTGGDGKDKAVDFRPHPLHTIGARTALGPATLRSGPMSFVTGNLEKGDVFRISGRCSGRSSKSFVFGYARVAKRWGWVQSANLRGDPCAP
jgi:hypothetical protein